MRYLMLISLLLTGCGQAHVDMPQDVQPYYDEYFQVVSPDKKNSGKIVIEEIDIFQLGKCDEPFLGTWTIRLNSLHWMRLSEEDRRILVFHELTHCTFGSKEHSKDPKSYMYTAQTRYLDVQELYEQTLAYTNGL